jgi:hypothetical protein
MLRTFYTSRTPPPRPVCVAEVPVYKPDRESLTGGDGSLYLDSKRR